MHFAQHHLEIGQLDVRLISVIARPDVGRHQLEQLLRARA